MPKALADARPWGRVESNVADLAPSRVCSVVSGRVSAVMVVVLLVLLACAGAHLLLGAVDAELELGAVVAARLAEHPGTRRQAGRVALVGTATGEGVQLF